MSIEKPYVPSSREVKKAEKMMSPEEKNMSEFREEKLQEMEKYEKQQKAVEKGDAAYWKKRLEPFVYDEKEIHNRIVSIYFKDDDNLEEWASGAIIKLQNDFVILKRTDMVKDERVSEYHIPKTSTTKIPLDKILEFSLR